MIRIMTFSLAVVSGCAPAASGDEMTQGSRQSTTASIAQGAHGEAARDPAPGGSATAAVAPSPAQVSAAANPVPRPLGATPSTAEGRRTLSTAFVRVGPDGTLTVTVSDGRELILRNVVMRAQDYCGQLLTGGATTGKYCGRYADVMAARPGGAAPLTEGDHAAPNPLKPKP